MSDDTQKTDLPPLPNHPQRGLSVEAGDTVTITDLSLSIEDLNEIEGKGDRAFHLRIPPWNSEYECGATYQLQQRMKEGSYNVDGNRVDIAGGGWNMEVALQHAVNNPVRATNVVAKRVLDILAAEAFRISELKDPLRQYGLWFRDEGEVVLRSVTTARMAVTMQASTEVRDPTGALKPQDSPELEWHASHSYFRRSQITDDLHDAYRNLFLALEALLSEVYPWEIGMGERKWLESALKHVVEGYELNMSDYVGEGGGNPYRRFINEQYRARRCALFHSKLGENPTIPGDLATRDDLVVATRRLGILYVELAKHITGAGFAGGMMSEPAFKNIVEGQADSPMYVSDQSDFLLSKCVLSNGEIEINADGQTSLHRLKGTWNSDDIPQNIQRIGVLVQNDDELVDGIYEEVDIDIDGASKLEVVMQYELANAEHLREWFL